MQIEIKNCNNINDGYVELKEQLLNVKYAINGTGKSTIAKAILASIEDNKSGNKGINSLTPFKHIGKNTGFPTVSGVEHISSIMVFDEAYINDFVFQADELVKGSFDIFIRDAAYDQGMKEIDILIDSMKCILAEDRDISGLISDFNEISNSFGKTTKTGIHGSSGLAKAFKDGNKVSNIPKGLENFKDYIQHTENYKWIRWQLEGKNYLEIADDCPYCTNNIKEQKELILQVSNEYDSKSIENLNKVVATFSRLNKYFSDDAKSTINDFVTNVSGYTEAQVGYLKEIKDQIDRLNAQFVNAQSIGFVSLKDVDKVIDILKTYRIDINLFVHLDSESTNEKIAIVNGAVDGLIEKAGLLQGGIAKQKRLIEKLVAENSKGINSFLKNAGYKYKVILAEDKTGSYRLKLVHQDVTEEINNVKTRLSFGERNAFALILFMYDALKCKPDLIVLDDPISSFDKNKKYAIIDMLFRGGNSFAGKTVLLLTHDFEPIVDMIYHHNDKFTKPFATFIENISGHLSEKQIKKSDIKTFIDINEENIKNGSHDVSKLVYLRRLYEVTNDKCLGYDLLSNLFHKRTHPKKWVSEEFRTMTDEEIASGCDEIEKFLPFFNYEKILNTICDNSKMKEFYTTSYNNYEKLHFYRIIFEGKNDGVDSDVIKKFINEAFHIENNYIYQLNSVDYQLVPQYVIDECDKYIESL